MNINPLVFFLMQIRQHGFWSLLKRSIFGVYHSVSAKHLNNIVINFLADITRAKQARAINLICHRQTD